MSRMCRIVVNANVWGQRGDCLIIYYEYIYMCLCIHGFNQVVQCKHLAFWTWPTGDLSTFLIITSSYLLLPMNWQSPLFDILPTYMH